MKSTEEIAQAYDSHPFWYDLRGFLILNFAYNSTLWKQIRFFAQNIGPNHLEIACGTGTLLRYVLNYRRRKKMPAGDVVGIDYALPMLRGAVQKFKNNAAIKIERADATALPYADSSFETVNIANSLHCIDNPDKALEEACRVLKPEGTLAANILLYPRGMWPLKPIAERINNWGVRKGILVTPYKLEDARERILKAGFKIAREETSGNCYFVIAQKLQTT